MVLPANSGTRGRAFRACIGLHQVLQFAFQLEEIGLRMFELVAQNLQAGAPRRERNATADGMVRQVHQLLSAVQPVVAWGQFMQRGRQSAPHSLPRRLARLR